MERPAKPPARIGRAWADYCRRLRERTLAMQERQHRERVRLAKTRRAMP